MMQICGKNIFFYTKIFQTRRKIIHLESFIVETFLPFTNSLRCVSFSKFSDKNQNNGIEKVGKVFGHEWKIYYSEFSSSTKKRAKKTENDGHASDLFALQESACIALQLEGGWSLRFMLFDTAFFTLTICI